MAPLRLVAALAIATTACVQQQYSDPTTFPEPAVVSGPPGGQMDPEWQAQSSGDYAEPTAVEPSANPDDPGFATGAVTDVEIDLTLEGYGEWVETDDYGRVWRPYATEVGADFTPYESCGSWIWTDVGWTFTCDWDWGWLPFHYGQWGWFDDYWAWVPDHEWSPAWVEWRGGGGYVGWRPQAPRVRDHRDGQAPAYARDHRDGPKPYARDHRDGPQRYARDHRRASSRDSHWRFAAEADFGKPHIRAHLFKSPAEGLRRTALQTRPALRGNVQAIRAASLMRNRFANGHVRAQIHVGSRPDPTRPARRPSFDRGRPPTYDRNPPRSRAFDRAFRDPQPSVYQPGYGQPSTTSTPPSRSDHIPPANVGPDRMKTQPAPPLPQPATRWGERAVQGTFTPASSSPPPPLPQQPSSRWGEREVQGTFTPASSPPPPPPSTPTYRGRGAPQGTFAPASSPPPPPPSTPTYRGRGAPQGTFAPASHAPPSSSPTPTYRPSMPSAPSPSPSRSPSSPSSSSSSSSSSHGWRGSSAPSSASPSSGATRSHRR